MFLTGKKTFLVLCFIVAGFNLQSQSISTFEMLNKYNKLGFSIGGAMFEYPKINPLEGSYTIKPIPIPSYSFGITFNIPIKTHWSIETGIFMVNEPSIFSKIVIPKEELFEDSFQDLEFETKMYSIYSTSLPILFKYNFEIDKKTILNIQMGLKLMYIIPNFSIGKISIGLSDNTIYSLLRIYTDSPDEYITGSFVYGIGYSYAFKYCLITTSLKHIINFQNTNNGYYYITNLKNSADSYGEYKLSGDYFSLNLNFQFLKFKSKKKVVK